MSLLKHMERWLDIEGYEGLYQVSSCGRVKSLGNGNSNNSKERFLKPKKNSDGYIHVDLYKEGNGKNFKIHRLVAQAFIPNPENLPQINHKNEIKTDNYVSNLEWCTSQYNTDYSKSKKVLCVETNKVYKSTREAERQTGIFQPSISLCCNGKRKTAGKFHWKFVD